jgi:hypothetical protein
VLFLTHHCITHPPIPPSTIAVFDSPHPHTPSAHPQKNRTPPGFRRVGFIYSGNVLLSRNLKMHYHRGCSVSLPCSEWLRVVPLRYCHQKAGEAEASPWGDLVFRGRSLLNFTRNSDDLTLRSMLCSVGATQSNFSHRLFKRTTRSLTTA